MLPDGSVIELEFLNEKSYRLACLRAGRPLVEYRSGGAYEFKSVEQLRYDFERDAEDALRQG